MQQLIVPVEEYTTPDPVTIEESVGFDELLKLMSRKSFRHLPVVRDGKPVGIISDRDVRLFAGMSVAERMQLTAGDIMSENPLSVDASTPLDQVALLMSDEKVGSLIVMEGDEFLGIFTATDALNALIEIVRGVAREQ